MRAKTLQPGATTDRQGLPGKALREIPLACPIDGLALNAVGRSYVCEHRHAYDMSRHGYVNLLPVQFKPSKSPGDSAGMVAARRRVLDAGLFDPLAHALAERVADCARSIVGSAPLLLDAGCGEGFYTSRVAEHLAEHGATRSMRVLGSDISGPAVEAAARRHRALGWTVANNTHLPIVRHAVGIITSLFGFETWAPWARLQDAGQWVVTVAAGPRHLIELREAIYERVRLRDAPSDAAALQAGYDRHDERRIGFERDAVPSSLLADVLVMTPHGHRAGRTAGDALAALDGTRLTIDTTVRVYRRRRSGVGS